MASSNRQVWGIPLVICCLLMIFLLISGTIVLALIPVYLSARNIDADINTQDDTILAGYASDVSDGSSLALSNTNSLSTQLTDKAGLRSDNVNLQSGSFASTVAANGKKRQTSNGNPVCEQATSLTGNIFVAQYRLKFPSVCMLTSCQRRYKAQVINALRMNHETFTVVMTFTNGQTRTVQLVFCTLLSQNVEDNPTDTDTTLETSNTTTNAPVTTPGGSLTNTTNNLTNSTDCTNETKNNIYLIDSNNTLYQFDPITLNTTEVGSINCSPSTVYAIALQRNGIIWALFTDGSLYNYIIDSQQCIPTPYVANQSDIVNFSMAFVKNNTDDSESLYISKKNDQANVLATIDLSTFNISIVGNYSALETYADLTGTNDGRLFGVFETDNFIIAEIDQTNAEIIAEYPLNISSTINVQPNYGFAAYNSRFFFFIEDVNVTDIYLFDSSTNTSTIIGTLPQIISDAAVSTCFGT